jgi:hypothetical protein
MRWAPATEERVKYVAKRLRASDQVEVRLSHGIDPYLVAVESWASSSICQAIVAEDGTPLGITGLDEDLIWLLGTDDLTSTRMRRMQLCREAEEWVQHCLKRVDGPIGNYVYAKNGESIRWLSKLGFTVFPAEPYGPSGALFHPFWRMS